MKLFFVQPIINRNLCVFWRAQIVFCLRVHATFGSLKNIIVEIGSKIELETA